jgi:hypothetical protein
VFLRVEAKRRGVTFESVTDPQADSDEGRLVTYIAGYAAKVERRALIARTQAGVRARVESGKRLVGCKPPYGYRWAEDRDATGRLIKGRLTVDPVTAPTVRRIFAEAAAGKNIRKIAGALTADGIPTPNPARKQPHTGPGWAFNTIYSLLRNPVYAGISVAFRRRAVPPQAGGALKTSTVFRPETDWVRLPDDTAPALIEPELWDQVQDRLARGRARSERSAVPKKDALCRGGIARCGYCGNAMHVNRSNWGVKYRCQNESRIEACGKGQSIDAAYVDRIVWSSARHCLSTPSALTKVAEALVSGESTTDLTMIDHELRAISGQEQRLANAIAAADSDSAAEVLVRKLNELSNQRERLQQERFTAQNQAAAREAARRGFEQLQEQFLEILENIDALDYDGKRDALERLGMGVEVRRNEPGVHRLIITANPNRDASGRALELMSVRNRLPSDSGAISVGNESVLSTAGYGPAPRVYALREGAP